MILSLTMALAFAADPKPAPQPKGTKDTYADSQNCGIDAHRHALWVNQDTGAFVVEREKGEPDIVFDGLCHSDDGSERPILPRKVLPVPKPEDKQ